MSAEALKMLAKRAFEDESTLGIHTAAKDSTALTRVLLLNARTAFKPSGTSPLVCEDSIWTVSPDAIKLGKVPLFQRHSTQALPVVVLWAIFLY